MAASGLKVVAIPKKGGVLRALIKQWWQSESAVTSIEYALIGALIAVVIAAAVTSVGLEVGAAFEYVASCVTNLECP